MDVKHTKLEPSPCGHCGIVLDAATDFRNGHAPKEGDTTICIKCTGINVFTAERKLRKISIEEFSELPDDLKAELNRLQNAVKQVKEKHAREKGH